MPSYPDLVRRRAIRWLAPAFTVVLLIACGGTEADPTPSGECTDDADCPTGERCASSEVCVDGDTPSEPVAEPECAVDEDCELYPGYACSDEGECYECEHGDPSPGNVEVAVWEPDAYVAGEDLGLDSAFAYLATPYEDLILNAEIQEIFACGDVYEGGEVVEIDSCTRWEGDAAFTTDDLVYLPVAPASWLMTGPTDGTFYRYFEVFDAGDYEPFYYC
ncbi:MAG: hypothetical protein AAGF92_10265 [Myxococcota bacterium]